MNNFIKEQWLFFQELRKHPGAIGAIFPSSKKLGKTMVEQIPKNTDGLIVELGPGTGAITKYLQKNFPSKQIVVIERSKGMCEYLHLKFSDINIVSGDARDLHKLIEPFHRPVEAIVSSLPLRSLAKQTVTAIETAAFECLPMDGHFIQFTYELRNNSAEILPKFKLMYHKTVWCNIPPAKVDVYQKC